MKNIAIIGAGKIGSRHLQALKAVNIPLNIFVVDPSESSLKKAKKIYDSINNTQIQHKVRYLSEIDINDKLDLAINATNSDMRRESTEKLFQSCQVNFLILEKILFQKAEDYYAINDLLKKRNCTTWVNCNIRTMPDYRNLVKKWFNKEKLLFTVTGSQWGLMCNAVHFIDYLSFLTECNEFEVNTEYLDKKLIPSKREGFYELSGIIQTHLSDGSHGILSCQPSGDLPIIINISSDTTNCSINLLKNEENMLICKGNSDWKTYNVEYLNVSSLTTSLVENILTSGKCLLPTYEYAMKLHLSFFEPVLEFLNMHIGKDFTNYPFT
ncbi:MAG: Gfo/Idh/MocA family oxidoreductase [Promethearchaeota archaeon]